MPIEPHPIVIAFGRRLPSSDTSSSPGWDNPCIVSVRNSIGPTSFLLIFRSPVRLLAKLYRLVGLPLLAELLHHYQQVLGRNVAPQAVRRRDDEAAARADLPNQSPQLRPQLIGGAVGQEVL